MARSGSPEESGTRSFIAPTVTRGAANGKKSGDLEAESARRTRLLAARPQSSQPLDQHRIGGQRLRAVHKRVEHLVVAGGRHREEFLDGVFLGPGVFPPLALERQDVVLAPSQSVGEIRVVPGLLSPRDRAVHIALGPFPTLEITCLLARRTFNHGIGS